MWDKSSETIGHETEWNDRSHGRKAGLDMLQRAHNTFDASSEESDAVRSRSPEQRYHSNRVSTSGVQKPSGFPGHKQRRSWRKRNRQHRHNHCRAVGNDVDRRMTFDGLRWGSSEVRDRAFPPESGFTRLSRDRAQTLVMRKGRERSY